MNPLLLNEHRSLVLVIDVQGKLAPVIHQGAEVIERNQWLLSVVTELNIPIWFSEQYPQGLGETVPELHKWRTPINTVIKSHFSAYETLQRQDAFVAFLKRNPNRNQIILTGTESHVCVLQTALDFVHHGWSVFVVADAVGSRTRESKEFALSRMRQAGVNIVNGEMVVFEWLNNSATERFKHISRNYLR